MFKKLYEIAFDFYCDHPFWYFAICYIIGFILGFTITMAVYGIFLLIDKIFGTKIMSRII